MRPPLAERLDLEPHPEGGWFRQTWRSSLTIAPDGYDGERAAATAIYYLLMPGERSRWHRVRSDELWLWHGGGPVTVRLGGTADEPEEAGTITVDATTPQFVVPGDVWQSAEPGADDPALVTCIVVPGFDYRDFELKS